jgi:hypothetical protein
MSDERPSLLIWESRGDDCYFAPFELGTIEIEPSAAGGYVARIQQVIGGGFADLDVLKELCQAWADANRWAISTMPRVLPPPQG